MNFSNMVNFHSLSFIPSGEPQPMFTIEPLDILGSRDYFSRQLLPVALGK